MYVLWRTSSFGRDGLARGVPKERVGSPLERLSIYPENEVGLFDSGLVRFEEALGQRERSGNGNKEVSAETFREREDKNGVPRELAPNAAFNPEHPGQLVMGEDVIYPLMWQPKRMCNHCNRIRPCHYYP